MDLATEEDVRAMIEVQLEIEKKPEVPVELDRLDQCVRGVMYSRHFSQEALVIRQRRPELRKRTGASIPGEPWASQGNDRLETGYR